MGLQHSATTNSGDVSSAASSIARRFVVLALRLRLFGDEQRPEFQDLARRVDFQMLLYIVQPDDACTDFAVKLLLGRAFVCRNQLAQYTSRKVDIEFGEPLGERRHTPFDVVLLFAFEEVLDRLLGLARRHQVEPFGFGTCVVGRDDLDLIAARNLRRDGFELMVDLRADRLVADVGVDVVGRNRAPWRRRAAGEARLSV